MSINIELTTKEGVVLQTEGKLCEENIIVIPTLQEKSTSVSGEVVADDSYAGLSKVIVSIPTYEVYDDEYEEITEEVTVE